MTPSDDTMTTRTPLPVVVLVNLGTPTEPTPAAVRPFLREFLSDRRVVDLPRWLWWPILNGIILTVRPRRSARLYESVWLDEGSPLMVNTVALATGVAERLQGQAEVRLAMTYGDPSLHDTLAELASEAERPVLVVPLHPQYAGSASGSIHDAAYRWGLSTRRHLDLRILGSFPTHPAYIEAVAAAIEQHWARVGPLDMPAGERLVLSYHGVPVAHVRRGDPYFEECRATTAAVVRRLGVPETGVLMTFQSKFGPGEWLTPATITTMAELGAAGTPRVDVVTPGFSADCLETLEEIDGLNRRAFTDAGGREFHYVPWANEAPAWCDALAALIGEALAGRQPTVPAVAASVPQARP